MPQSAHTHPCAYPDIGTLQWPANKFWSNLYHRAFASSYSRGTQRSLESASSHATNEIRKAVPQQCSGTQTILRDVSENTCSKTTSQTGHPQSCCLASIDWHTSDCAQGSKLHLKNTSCCNDGRFKFPALVHAGRHGAAASIRKPERGSHACQQVCVPSQTNRQSCCLYSNCSDASLHHCPLYYHTPINERLKGPAATHSK